MNPKRITSILGAIGATLLLQGCIVQDIHDQIALSNEKLAAIDENFAKVERANELLADLEKQLDRLLPPINDNLTLIEAQLESIDAQLVQINANLASMDTSIEQVEADLKSVSESLTSLRKTISNIDSTIPFLNFSGDTDEPDPEATNEENTESTEQPAPEPEPETGGQ